jgi:hypothetical protein
MIGIPMVSIGMKKQMVRLILLIDHRLDRDRLIKQIGQVIIKTSKKVLALVLQMTQELILQTMFGDKIQMVVGRIMGLLGTTLDQGNHLVVEVEIEIGGVDRCLMLLR